MGEESYVAGKDVLTNDTTWIVDPIDGTTNFIHGIPMVAVSIGVTMNKEPVVGVIHNPFTRVTYVGRKGNGAYRIDPLNDRMPLPIVSIPLPSLSGSVFAVEWGSDRADNNFDVKRHTFTALTSAEGGMVHGLRSWGSAALNLCAVAEGCFDGYWEGGCWPWDVCAGWVILKESGGIIVDGNPSLNILQEADLCGRRYLAIRHSGQSGSQEALVKEFYAAVRGRMDY